MTELSQTAELANKFQLKPEMVKKYKSIFDEYDKEQDGHVLLKDLPIIFKILGGNVTEADITSILGEKIIPPPEENKLVSPKVQFEDFLALIIQKQGELIMKEELMESFRVFDPDNNGFIPLNQFRYLMKTYGTPFQNEQVEEMMKDCEAEEGLVKYEKFVNLMLGIS